MAHSAEISEAVFIHFLSLEDDDYDEKVSDMNYAYFKISDDLASKEFDYHDFNYLIQDYQKSFRIPCTKIE